MSLLQGHQGGSRIEVPPIGTQGDLDTIATLHGEKSGTCALLRLTMVNLNAVGWSSINVRASLASLGPVGDSVAVTTLEAGGHAANSTFKTLRSNPTIGPEGLLEIAVPPFSVAHAEVCVRHRGSDR